MRLLMFVLTLLVAAQTARADTVIELKSGDLSIQVGARDQANLLYHVDCLARAITCTSEAYEQLWKEQLGFDEADAQLVKEWASLRRAIQQSDKGGDPTLPIKASVPIFGARADSPLNKLRWAEFVTADASELSRVWASSTRAETAARFSAIADHFRPRFDGWWKEHENELTIFIPGLEAAMRQGRAGELLNAAARFYRADLGDRRVFVHLYLQPKRKSPNTRASRIGAHMTVEVVPGERPADRVDVIVHELAHHVFACMPPEGKAALADALLRTGTAGVPAWNLFDEVQATVIGNFLTARNVLTPEEFQKVVDRPRSFYADETIDLGARATQALFERAFKKRARMTPAFGEAFVAVLRAGLGARLETPALHLRSMVLNVDTDESPWPAKLRKVVSSSSVWTESELGGAEVTGRLDRFPGLSVVAFAKPDQLAQLARGATSFGVSADALTGTLGPSRGMVFVSQRTPQAYAFIFVARDDGTMDGLIAAFPSCQLKAGVCVRFE
jgi:hypothetical protein